MNEEHQSTVTLSSQEVSGKHSLGPAPVGLYLYDYASGELVASRRLKEIWGSTDIQKKQDLFSSVRNADWEQVREAYIRAEKQGTLGYEARILLPGGEERHVRVKGEILFDAERKPAKELGLVIDVTDKNIAFEALTDLVREKDAELLHQAFMLQSTEQMYQRMIAEVEDYAILSLDEHGTILNWNKGAENIKGYKESEIVGKSFKEFYLPEDRARLLPDTLIDHARREGKAVQEGLRLRKDGSTFWGSIVITALHDEKGRVVGFSKVTRDLTERKQSEDKIQQYARELERQNDELQQFAFVASHDLKEPLRKISINNSLLIEKLEGRLTDKEKQILSRSVKAAERMACLIDDILNYSKTINEKPDDEMLDLNLLLMEQIDELRYHHRDIQIDVQLEPLPKIRAVRHQMAQLFDNLFTNAVKYRDPKRAPLIRVHAAIVQARPPDAGEQSPDAVQAQNYLKIMVTDNGIGIDSGQERKIFDLFYRLKNTEEVGGTGVGLAVCKKIAEHHGGWINAERQPDGTRFSIYLPARLLEQ